MQQPYVFLSDASGSIGDAIKDCTPGFNLALLEAAPKSMMIEVGLGIWMFLSQPNSIPSGIPIKGNGSVGSTPGYGTMLQCGYNIASGNQGFMTSDGSLTVGFAGTGGGFRDLFIEHDSLTSGGCAIRLASGADDNHRSGCNKIDNVGLGVTGSGGNFNKGLVVDGTGRYTPGGAGIRTTWLDKVDISCCSDVDSNIWLFNAVHFHAVNVHCYPGPGLCGITVDGTAACPSTNIFFSGCNIDGNLTLDHVLDFHYFGRIGGNLTFTPNSQNVYIWGGVYGTRSSNQVGSTVYVNGVKQ